MRKKNSQSTHTYTKPTQGPFVVQFVTSQFHLFQCCREDSGLLAKRPTWRSRPIDAYKVVYRHDRQHYASWYEGDEGGVGVGKYVLGCSELNMLKFSPAVQHNYCKVSVTHCSRTATSFQQTFKQGYGNNFNWKL